MQNGLTNVSNVRRHAAVIIIIVKENRKKAFHSPAHANGSALKINQISENAPKNALKSMDMLDELRPLPMDDIVDFFVGFGFRHG